MRNVLDKRHLKLLVNAYVKSHLEYNCNLLTLCNKTTLKPLELCFKKTIRILCNAGYNDHTAPLFKSEGILPVDKLIEYNAIKFMHSYYYKYCPKTFLGTWKLNSEGHNHDTRIKDDFHIEHRALQYFSNFPLFKFPDLWNKLDKSLKIIRDKNEFLRKLKNHLFQSF